MHVTLSLSCNVYSMCLTPISDLASKSALMGKIVISQLTFNNIWEQEAHLLSLFVLPD